MKDKALIEFAEQLDQERVALQSLVINLAIALTSGTYWEVFKGEETQHAAVKASVEVLARQVENLPGQRRHELPDWIRQDLVTVARVCARGKVTPALCEAWFVEESGLMDAPSEAEGRHD